jgi:hypothetical protein
VLMRDSIILKGILSVESKLQVILRWTVVVLKKKIREMSRMNITSLSLHL